MQRRDILSRGLRIVVGQNVGSTFSHALRFSCFAPGFVPRGRMMLSAYSGVLKLMLCKYSSFLVSFFEFPLDFEGNQLNVVLPNSTAIWGTVYQYDNGSSFRAGGDFEAAKYLERALNFRLKY